MRPTNVARLALIALLAFASPACDDPAPPPPDPSPSPSTTPTASPRPAAIDLPADAIRGNLVFSNETTGALDDIFSLDLADPEGPAIRLTRAPESEFDPDLSPDGERIVYRVNPDLESDAADLWLMNADGSDPVNLTGDPALNNWSPAWSPDGSRIAFTSSREGGTLRLWTMASDGSDVRSVTATHGEYPDWSPDGQRIVYAAPARGSSGRYELWLIDALGIRPAEQLTNTGVTEFAPAWSPNGEWIAYQRDELTRWELWIIRPDGSEEQRVSPEGEDGVWPVWSPDGVLGWSGTQGLSFLDLSTGGRRSFEPAEPGTNFLSWGS